ncbi:E3 ubiquitin-protein ligase UBR2-like [Pomacea canaliculata]|uniref:E3 ubiquitin-protein ligase UBR2-like n=1 Tax=Pomacea canaliculata TaxID=400727 RepID=UPI000D7341C6|nr:E3 ubiquitin-protein ligase UBR2-like [Pomacea canaliculata]
MAQAKNAYFAQVPSFRLETVIEEWNAAYEKGELSRVLKTHWALYVPAVFSCGHDSEKEQRRANTFLFHPLETFFCSGDPITTFQELKDRDNPSQICGHVFRSGEPTYSCRDCANDPTCVLCISCFQKSKHRSHKYRMSTSGGGGYCDCGDPEAWKSDPACDEHKANSSSKKDKDSLAMLPEAFKDRISEVFSTVLKYIVDLLTWNDGIHLPEGLQPEGEVGDDCHCMLFNDEVHTYEQVITTLQRAIDCTKRQAVDLATIVDREGRSSVKQGTFNECEKVSEMIKRSTSRHGSKPLKVMVMHNLVVAHQTFVLRCIDWLQTIINKSEGLRHLFCLISMQPRHTGDSLMEHLIMADTQLWKMARVMCHQLLMSGVLKDAECKKQFAVIFTKHYPQMMQDFNEDDHDHDVSVTSLSVQIYTVPSLHYASLMADFVQDDHYRSVSITSISVQIFTVPTLARMLVKEHDLINVILKSFLKHCQEKKNRVGKLSFERSERNATFKRACYMLYDLKYALLCKPAMPEEWSDGLRNSFLNGFVSMLNLLKMMQGMDSVIRQTAQHLEFEPEWEGAFNLQLKLEDSLVLFSDWCSSDRFLLIEAYKETTEALCHCREKVEKERVEVGGHTAKCIRYDVSSQPVSVHLPVTRFFASLYMHLADFGLKFDSAVLMTRNRLEIMELLEPALRVQVLVAQAQAGMWRRNGFSLLNQIYFYTMYGAENRCTTKNIILMQISASLMDSDEFLISCLNKFGWPDYDNLQAKEDFLRQTVTLAESFLKPANCDLGLVFSLSEQLTQKMKDSRFTTNCVIKAYEHSVGSHLSLWSLPE